MTGDVAITVVDVEAPDVYFVLVDLELEHVLADQRVPTAEQLEPTITRHRVIVKFPPAILGIIDGLRDEPGPLSDPIMAVPARALAN